MELTFDTKEIVQTVKNIILRPKFFFQNYASEKDIKPAIVFSITMSAIASIFGVILLLIVQNTPALANLLPQTRRPNTFLEVIPVFFVSAVMTVLLSFVWAKLLEFWLKITGVKLSFLETFKAYSYSRAPLSILGWVPFLGIFFSLIYSNYVLILGLSHYSKESFKKVAIRVVVFLLVMFVPQAIIAVASGI